MTVIRSAILTVGLLLAAAMSFAGPVNVNTADAETLSAELTGIGMVKARAIVEYREQNGPFRSADDLLNVQGVGQRTLDMNRENILIDDAGAPARN